MSLDNYTIKEVKKQYHHLTIKERAQIELLVNELGEDGKRIYSNAKIAKKLGVNRSTIGRELKNRIHSKMYIRTGKQKNLSYTAEIAQDDYQFKRGMSKAEYIIEKYPKMKKYIENQILKEKWAPDTIAGYMNKMKMYEQEGFTSISTTTIYRAIHYGVLKVKKADTRRMIKFEGREKYANTKPVAESKRANSIELRDEKINKREEFGHWELDTVLGTKEGETACLLTLTERKTRYEIIFKLNSKTSEEVTKFFKLTKDKYGGKFNDIFKTFTTDNGCEFSKYKEIMEYTNTMIYFCHPYASCEKGTNEKHNGMIRYFIPKGINIGIYTQKEINNIAGWMNEYPRKILGYSTPKEELIRYIKDIKILEIVA